MSAQEQVVLTVSVNGYGKRPHHRPRRQRASSRWRVDSLARTHSLQ